MAYTVSLTGWYVTWEVDLKGKRLTEFHEREFLECFKQTRISREIAAMMGLERRSITNLAAKTGVKLLINSPFSVVGKGDGFLILALRNKPDMQIKISSDDILVMSDSAYKWFVHIERTKAYVWSSSSPSGKVVKLHRVLMGASETEMIDHKNGDGLDNRRENLRFATSRQNAWNSRGSDGRLKGVWFDNRTKTWTGIITGPDKHRWCVGYHRDFMTAAVVRDEMARRLHGDFAFLNFPENVPTEDTRLRADLQFSRAKSCIAQPNRAESLQNGHNSG